MKPGEALLFQERSRRHGPRFAPAAAANLRSFRHGFTLIELMVAMVVLVVLMAMLFAIISGAQEAYSLADSNAMIYEKAHILFDQLSRDLRSAVTSDLKGREIPLWIAPAGVHDPTDADKQDMLCAVVGGPMPNSVSKVGLVKVRYAFHTKAGEPGANTVRRSCAGDMVTTGPSPNPRWCFYGKTAANETTDSDGYPDWVEDSETRHPIIGGVEAFTIVPYPACSGTMNHLPQAFIVTLTLVDERALSLPEPVRTQRLKESRRTFRKVIFIGGEG